MSYLPSTGGVSDGNKGDVTVSGGGTVWTVTNGSSGKRITAVGSSTLVSTGILSSVTILTALATSTCQIALTPIGNTDSGILSYTISAGVSFTVISTNTYDARSFSYTIIEP